MIAYTDYPVNGSEGVIQVELLCYDRNKYVKVRRGEDYEDIKSGYLFQDQLLTRRIQLQHLCTLPEEMDGPKPTRRQTQAELKEMRRHKKTEYVIYVNEVKYPVLHLRKNAKYKHRNLRDALRHFGRIYKDQDCSLMRHQEVSYSFSSEFLIESEDGHLLIPMTSRNKTPWRRRYYKIGGF